MIRAYLCDRKKCRNCSYPECKYTEDITHAKNFTEVEKGIFVERELKNGNENVLR